MLQNQFTIRKKTTTQVDEPRRGAILPTSTTNCPWRRRSSGERRSLRETQQRLSKRQRTIVVNKDCDLVNLYKLLGADAAAAAGDDKPPMTDGHRRHEPRCLAARRRGNNPPVLLRQTDQPTTTTASATHYRPCTCIQQTADEALRPGL